MTIPLIQVDAFTHQPFTGNPAAVCLLDGPRAEDWMQAVAGEMNLSETAFVWPLQDQFSLRWFTPTIEVDLCGHATIAVAHAMWTEDVVKSEGPIKFETRSGTLTACRNDDLIQLDFPATPPVDSAPATGLLEALGSQATYVGKTKFDFFVVVESEAVLRSLEPDFRGLVDVATRGVIATCHSDDPELDFVSRFFAPAAGVDEDPVTGSAHCALAPYWSQQLGKQNLVGYQASTRGGIVHVEYQGERVMLGGRAVTILRGELDC